MTIYTTATKPVEVITKNATPYDVDGNKGITYRLVVMADNDVEKLKVVDEKTYNLFHPGQKYLLTGQFDVLILSILVDTFISKISFPMQPGPEIVHSHPNLF